MTDVTAAAISSVSERIKYRVDDDGCHIWQRARNNRGYGVIWFNGKVHLAHRVVWRITHGAWPTEGLVLDHVCEKKDCVNVDHLRESTNHANIRRAYPCPDDGTRERRIKWRIANEKRRAYGPLYTVGGD